MSEYEAGLHKKISAIFDGVPIPGGDNVSLPAYVSAQNQSLAVAPNPPASDQPPSQQSSQPPPSETPPQLQPQTSAHNSQQTAAPPVKAASPKPQKTDAAAAVAKQGCIRKLFTRMKAKFFKPARGAISARQKVMTIFVPVLFVIFIFVFVRLFSAPVRQTAEPPKTVQISAPVVAAETIKWKIPDPWPETLRDPMRLGPAANDAAENSTIVIKGIVYSQDNPAVVIGMQVLHQGAKVSGATITKITEDQVEFEMNGKKWTQKVQR